MNPLYAINLEMDTAATLAHSLILKLIISFCPENVVCFLHLLHIIQCTEDSILSWKQTL